MNDSASLQHFHDVARRLRLPSQAFIDGDWVSARSGETFETLNPATGAVLGAVAHCDSADIDAAVQAARRTFRDGEWSRCAPEHRKDILLKLARLIRENVEELAVLESVDSGKTITDCLAEIGEHVPTFFQWYAELADKTFGKVAPTGDDALALIMKEPIGVVGLVLPWNFPLLMAAWKLAPALAVGCSAVVKPAEQTPLSTLRLAELAMEAGMPAGVLNVVPGLGQTAGQAIGRHMDVDVVSFTGSTEVGALFLRYASESNLKPVGLEMGGKSPLVVLDDANIDDHLISNAVSAACWNGGQNCSANMRQIVHASRKEDFLHKVVEQVAALKVGDPLDPGTQMGSMVTDEQRRRVAGYVAKGKAEGAHVAYEKEELVGQGFFLNPTVFDGVTPNMTIAREEIFGPVLGVIEVTDNAEALEVALATDYGLHASVFTRDMDKAMHFARRLPCGTVSVNCFSEGDVKTPFGGYKQSGSLARDNGVEALDQYVQTKTIWFNVRSPSRA